MLKWIKKKRKKANLNKLYKRRNTIWNELCKEMKRKERKMNQKCTFFFSQIDNAFTIFHQISHNCAWSLTILIKKIKVFHLILFRVGKIEFACINSKRQTQKKKRRRCKKCVEKRNFILVQHSKCSLYTNFISCFLLFVRIFSCVCVYWERHWNCDTA